MSCSIHPSQLPNDEPGTKDTARPAAAELLRLGGEQCARKFALTPLAPPAGLWALCHRDAPRRGPLRRAQRGFRAGYGRELLKLTDESA